MPNNTKARSNFLRSIAEEIIKRENLDLENPPLDKRAYIREIAERGNCHTETARTVFNGTFGAMRWGHNNTAYAAWGGAGRGQGRKKKTQLLSTTDALPVIVARVCEHGYKMGCPHGCL